MAIIFAARAAMTLLKVGPTILRAKPIIFASRLTPTGQVIGGFVQSIATSKGISIALNSQGITDFIASKVIGSTLDPITQGRISSIDKAGNAVIDSVQDIRRGRPTLRGVGDIAGVWIVPTVGPAVMRNLVGRIAPAWVMFFI